jgi:hypothetical protein
MSKIQTPEKARSGGSSRDDLLRDGFIITRSVIPNVEVSESPLTGRIAFRKTAAAGVQQDLFFHSHVRGRSLLESDSFSVDSSC